MNFSILRLNAVVTRRIRRCGLVVLVAAGLASAVPAIANAVGAPVAHILSLHVDSRHHRATARFTGTGGAPPLSFWCVLDAAKGHYCHSPLTIKHLRRGEHKLMIEAIDSTGLASEFLAIRTF